METSDLQSFLDRNWQKVWSIVWKIYSDSPWNLITYEHQEYLWSVLVFLGKGNVQTVAVFISWFCCFPSYSKRLLHRKCTGTIFILELQCIKKTIEWAQQMSEFFWCMAKSSSTCHGMMFLYVFHSNWDFFLTDWHISKIRSQIILQVIVSTGIL